MNRLIGLVAAFGTLLCAQPAWAGSLESLMADLAKVKERHARFVEERTLGVLDQPLTTEGTLSYQAPDRLIRQDLLPDPAVYTLDGDRLEIVVDGKEQVLSLNQEPQLQALIAPFRAIFAGDLAALEQEFDVAYMERSDRWIVTLAPKADSATRPFLARIEIEGADSMVQWVDVRERNGDRSTMRLEHTAPP